MSTVVPPRSSVTAALGWLRAPRVRFVAGELLFAVAAAASVGMLSTVAKTLERSMLIEGATIVVVSWIAVRAARRIVGTRIVSGSAPASMGIARFGGRRESPSMTGVINAGGTASPAYLRLVAFHEAAHALVGHVRGATVLSMTMNPLGSGYTRCAYGMDNTDPAEVSATYRTLALVALAGWTQDADHPNTGASGDWTDFTDYAYRCVSMGQAASFDEFFDGALVEVRTILGEHRPALETLAEALLEHRSLDQDQIARVLAA